MICDIVMDGGGSGTRLGLVVEGRVCSRLEGPSCNLQSSGPGGLELVAGLLEQLWSARPVGIDKARSACLALSNANTRSALLETEQALLALRGAGSPPLQVERLWLMNDIVPALAAGACDAVALCGTGTGFAAMSAAGRWARASGLEYLISDEGGGFDIGRRGLAAVVRMHDGRGPMTALSTSAEAWAGVGAASLPEALCEKIHASVSPKIMIASFAPAVLTAAAQRDAVASEILTGAARELAAGVRAVASRCRLGPPVRVGIGGSLLLAEEGGLRQGLASLLPSPEWELNPLPADPLETVAQLVARMTRDPDRLAKVPLAVGWSYQ